MTRSIHQTTGHISPHSPQALAGWVLILALAFMPSVSLHAGAPPASLRISNTGQDLESLQTFQLGWDASSNATYLVQSATSLAPGSPWQTLDAVQSPDKAGSYQLAVTATDSTGLSSPPAEFYRLILPSPQIFSVEPAVIAPGVSVDLYVLGQCLGTNVVLQINGVTQSGTVYQSSSTMVQPSFTPDVAGNYQFSLVVSGVVVSSFNVTSADAVANPELVLQGPPEALPASPVTPPNAQFLEGDPDQPLIAGRLYNGVGAGKITFNPFSITRKIDRASPSFFNNFTAGGGEIYTDKYGRVKVQFFWDWEGKKSAECLGDDGFESDLTPVILGQVEKSRRDQINGGAVDVGVQPFSGEVQECVVDMAIPGRGLDFVWARTYHSRIGRFGVATNGWTFSYDVRCAQNSAGGMDVYDGTGRKDTFSLQTNGVYICPEFFREGTISNNTLTLTFADTGRWVFNPFDGTVAAGKLIQIITRNGDTMTLGYDTSGRLVQVVDDLGRTNTLSYNTSSQLASVTDFTGRSVTYQYYQGATTDNGSAGDLASVTSPPVTGTPNGNDFPSGKTTAYTYSKSFPLDRENHLLLTVTDPKGQTAAVFSYEHSSTATNYLRCIAAQEGTNPAFIYSWSLVQRPSGSSAVIKCIANDPAGNVSESFFDARGRCVIERDYTGRATPGLPVTDTVNRPTGQLRETDPVAWMRAWSWNNDSLCTSETSPGGQQMQNVYQSDFDPTTTARKRADCRVVRELAASAVDLNGDGALDVTDRAWYYTYDPRFGSDPTPQNYCVQYRETDFNFVSRLMEEEGIFYFFQSADAKRPTQQSLGLRESPTKQGLGAARLLPTVNKRGGVAAELFFDGYEKGASAMYVNPRSISRQQFFFSESSRLLPTVNKKAITTKGTGAIASRIRPRGWDGTIKGLIVPAGNGMAIKEKGTGADKNRAAVDFTKDYNVLSFEGRDNDCDGFVTSTTDPRGNVTTGTYDANGNRVKVQFFWDRQSTADRDFTYNPNGQLTTITNAPDANGHRSLDTFIYYTNGPQTGYLERKIEDDVVGITTSYEYDARGNVTRVIDPRTNDWLYTYNALDECVQSQSALLGGGGGGAGGSWRVTTQYAYDANDNFVQRAAELRDASGNLQGSRTDNFQYDGLDRLSEIALAVDATHALTNRFVYDGNDQCVQVLGGDAVSGADPQQTVAYQYDERDLLFHEITAGGSSLAATNEFSYDANGNTARVNKIEAIVVKQITFTRDGFDRLASVTDPMGNQTVCFYDANDNPKIIRLFGEINDVPGSAANVRLAESSYQYDGLDRCVLAQDLFFNPATQSAIGSGQSLTTFAYAPNDECVNVTDTLGHTTTYGYDTACRPVSVTDALGNQRSVVYDAGANPLVEISSELPAAGGKPQVFSVTNVYDTFNRCVSSMDSAGNTSSCAYDSLGRMVQTMDPRGTRTFYSYDLLDRLTIAIGDLNGDGFPDFTHDITTTFAWSSSSDNLLAVTDSNTNTTSYDYDSLGRCIAVSHADGTQEQMTWSPRSNLIGQQDADGTTITNTYDLSDRLVHRDIAARNVLATTTFETFAYDGCGRLTSEANDNGGGAFAYDSLDDCVSETINGLATTSTYDALGNRLSLTYPGGRTLAYTYDVLNRCASITDSGQQLVSYAYDGPDRVSLINYGNGTRTQIAYDGLAGRPNAQGDYGFGQVSRVRHGVVASGVAIDDRTFGYDPDQNKTARDMTSPFTLGGAAQAMSFQYDPACRLVNSLVTTNGAVARLTAYGLDRMGNRTNVTGATSCSGDYTMSSTIPPADFQMNQYTATPCDARSYDDNGNLINRSSPTTGQVSYQYDYADRLVQVQSVDFSGGVPAMTTAIYAYDALGRRISKSVSSGGLPPATTQFLYDGDSVIEERASGATAATYVSPPGSSGTCLTMHRSGQDYYLHTDDQGNLLALTTTGGAVVERYDYDDYGAVTFLTSDGFPTTATSSAVGNPYCWGGLRLDPETGLHNNDSGGYVETQSGRGLRDVALIAGAVGKGAMIVSGNNPWSGGGGGEMQKGTVKFFNDAKGFVFMAKTHTKTGHVTLMK